MISPSTSSNEKVDLCRAMARVNMFTGNQYFYGNLDPMGRATVAGAVLTKLEKGQDATLNPPGKMAVNAVTPALANSGHLVARSFGGHNRMENLVTQHKEFNQQAVWLAVEQPIYNHLKKGTCKTVCFAAIPFYKANMPAPSSIKYITVLVDDSSQGGGSSAFTIDMRAFGMEGNYNAEADPWKSVGLSAYPNGIGPVN